MMLIRTTLLLLTLLLGGSNSFAQDLASFDAKSCGPVNATDPKFIAWNANWCGGGGATLTIGQQAARGYCRKYMFSFGAAHQNELYRLAILNAKKDNFNDAVAMIAACQCHNPPIHDLAYVQSRQLICYLRTQNY